MGGLIVAFVLLRGRPASAPAQSAGLAPTAAAVRYKFPLTAVEDSVDTESTIATLEARNKAMPSPFDAAELADLYFSRAMLRGDRKDYAASEAAAKQSLELLRKPNGAAVTLAKIRNAHHEFREAIELANEAIASKPGPQAYIVIATARLALGELAQAADAAQMAVTLKPDTNGYSMRALVLQAQGRDGEAAIDFARAVAAEQPGDKQAAARLRALWARFLIRRGEYAGAAMVLDEALRIVPQFPLALAQRGELALRTGKAKDAAKLFEQAFEQARQVRYLMDEARAQELAGDRTGAAALRTQIETIVRGELASDGLGHRLDLIEVLTDSGNAPALAEAIKLGREELLRRGSFEARFQVARALLRAGNLDEAALQIQAALATGAREAQGFELAAQVEARRGNADRAALYTREADKLDPARAGWRALGLTP
ncbi:MAG: tetratricopeptide repeat protein [Kofleriaceae bacterium]